MLEIGNWIVEIRILLLFEKPKPDLRFREPGSAISGTFRCLHPDRAFALFRVTRAGGGSPSDSSREPSDGRHAGELPPLEIHSKRSLGFRCEISAVEELSSSPKDANFADLGSAMADWL